ncbi:MAG: Gfo/Idh/MocA family oxidoreductase [Clostridia bacterium]|nr:Gfo/Idh/MocA family oxidoreductase [Clostridia bacterium]
MSGQKIGIGIIGCGVIAEFHANAVFSLSDEADLIGVADVNPSAAESFAARHGVRAFRSVEEMLACPAVDLVNICTPSGYHAEAAVQAAEAKKHILVEKPMAITLEQLDRITEACDRNGVVLSAVSQNRFLRGVEMAKKAMDDRLLGRLVSADIYMKYHRSADYYASGAWRGTKAVDGGGALMNQGIHGIDLLLYLAGPVKRVSAFSKTLIHDIEVEDTLSAILEFECGALGVVQATTSVYPGYPRRLELNGDRGTIVLNEGSIERWDILNENREDVVVQPSFTGGSFATPTAISIDGHARQIRDVIRAIKTGTKPLIDCREGRKPVELILAIYRSAEEGRPVELNGAKPEEDAV